MNSSSRQAIEPVYSGILAHRTQLLKLARQSSQREEIKSLIYTLAGLSRFEKAGSIPAEQDPSFSLVRALTSFSIAENEQKGQFPNPLAGQLASEIREMLTSSVDLISQIKAKVIRQFLDKQSKLENFIFFNLKESEEPPNFNLLYFQLNQLYKEISSFDNFTLKDVQYINYCTLLKEALSQSLDTKQINSLAAINENPDIVSEAVRLLALKWNAHYKKEAPPIFAFKSFVLHNLFGLKEIEAKTFFKELRRIITDLYSATTNMSDSQYQQVLGRQIELAQHLLDMDPLVRISYDHETDFIESVRLLRFKLIATRSEKDRAYRDWVFDSNQENPQADLRYYLSASERKAASLSEFYRKYLSFLPKPYQTIRTTAEGQKLEYEISKLYENYDPSYFGDLETLIKHCRLTKEEYAICANKLKQFKTGSLPIEDKYQDELDRWIGLQAYIVRGDIGARAKGIVRKVIANHQITLSPIGNFEGNTDAFGYCLNIDNQKYFLKIFRETEQALEECMIGTLMMSMPCHDLQHTFFTNHAIGYILHEFIEPDASQHQRATNYPCRFGTENDRDVSGIRNLLGLTTGSHSSNNDPENNWIGKPGEKVRVDLGGIRYCEYNPEHMGDPGHTRLYHPGDFLRHFANHPDPRVRSGIPITSHELNVEDRFQVTMDMLEDPELRAQLFGKRQFVFYNLPIDKIIQLIQKASQYDDLRNILRELKDQFFISPRFRDVKELQELLSKL
ncbi:MAG: hypothetical protein SFT81_06310 [Candidatus Caenarcaniphilales bacterium]|nr:hypothetical protein [Candidatus Caenarcaniphilales bacterium]